MPEFISLDGMSDEHAQEVLNRFGVGLTVAEAHRVESMLMRAPSVTELFAFSAQWSEHCSYKSSRKYLRQFSTDAPNVILGLGEDAGIVAIAGVDGDRYGIVIGHESHNHPSQVVPYEGAATGVGGIVRDIVCMGARVIGVADPLRFGSLHELKTKWLFDGVTSGIGGYGNPLGVPVIAGDISFNDSFNQNCLVNVVGVGVVKESNIIHSSVPAAAADELYHVIIVGKATDMSGFGGASFASYALDEGDDDQNKGAVQEPNAFLERHLLSATYELFNLLRERGDHSRVGFKDIGGGGLLTASAEMAGSQGLGVRLQLDRVPVSISGMHPAVILTAETQERFLWMVPRDMSELILAHYNETWDLPRIMTGACAAVIGQVHAGNYQAYYGNDLEVDISSRDLVHGISYDRPVRELVEQQSGLPSVFHDINDLMRDVVGHPNVCSRQKAYQRYDKQVQGQVVIEAGEADAGVLRPLEYEDVPEDVRKVGIALSVDGNPRYGRLSPYWQGANAVCEAMRNVAAVGAVPWALTDCLNYGNPENPHHMWQFVEGVRGVADAAREIRLKGYDESPVPVVSGNVSFYNESKKHNGISGSIDPCAIVACLGRMDNAAHAVTFQLKHSDSVIILIGERRDECGGSVYYDVLGALGEHVPRPDFGIVQREIYAVTDCIERKLVRACHDISEGGLAVALAEMCFGGRGQGRIGVSIRLDELASPLPAEKILFSETGGFVLEIDPQYVLFVESILNQHGVWWKSMGVTTKDDRFVIMNGQYLVVDYEVEYLAQVWKNGFTCI